MISYGPFYKTLYEKNITEYQLIFKEGISANTLHRMKKESTCYVTDAFPFDTKYFLFL